VQFQPLASNSAPYLSAMMMQVYKPDAKVLVRHAGCKNEKTKQPASYGCTFARQRMQVITVDVFAAGCPD
jgi:hypothetical protein